MARKIGLKNLIVNPLGEVVHNGTCICSSVNVKELAHRLGRRTVQKDIDREFERIIRSALTEPAAARVIAVWRLQEYSDGRFRVWMPKGGKPVVSTEFSALTKDKKAWQTINAAAKSLGVKPTVTYAAPHCDRRSVDGGKTWIEGPHHGEMEREVAIDMPLLRFTKSELGKLVRRATAATEDAWQASGVCVV